MLWGLFWDFLFRKNCRFTKHLMKIIEKWGVGRCLVSFSNCGIPLITLFFFYNWWLYSLYSCQCFHLHRYEIYFHSFSTFLNMFFFLFLVLNTCLGTNSLQQLFNTFLIACSELSRSVVRIYSDFHYWYRWNCRGTWDECSHYEAYSSLTSPTCHTSWNEAKR